MNDNNPRGNDAPKFMKLHAAGILAAERWAPGTGGTVVYAVKPYPAFNGLDGSEDWYGPQPLDGEPFDEEKWTAHLRQRRQAEGVTWEDTLARHLSAFPAECDAEAQRLARPTFP